MTDPTPAGYLDFFLLEAGDYVEQLDAQLLAGGAAGPDAETLQRIARALRGSATMARLASFAELAAGVERVSRALRDGTLRWDSRLNGVIVAAIDDCKVLLRHVRTWSDGDERRARDRIAELTRYAAVRGPTPLAGPSLAGHDGYLAAESSNIGAGLELLVTRPGDRDAAVSVLGRVRALRGIASVKDHVALSDVLEAVEQALRPLELGESVLSPERTTVLQAAAQVLRSVADSIRAGATSVAPAAAVARLSAALDAMQDLEIETDRVVPIAALFYDDGGATVVATSANPPTTPNARFRLELTSQGEHLSRLIAEARGANDDQARDRARRSLKQGVRFLQQSAESFGEHDVANFTASLHDAAGQLDALALETLGSVARILSDADPSGASIGQRLSAVGRRHASQAAPIAAMAAQVNPSASRLGNLLDAGIRSLDALARTPLSVPATIPEQPAVPIDVLLYRGRAAMQRCVAIRDDARRAGGAMPEDALAELFDLLDLALTD